MKGDFRMAISEPTAVFSIRDDRDMHRDTAPLVQAKDAVFIDSSHMTIEEVTEEIIRLAKERGA